MSILLLSARNIIHFNTDLEDVDFPHVLEGIFDSLKWDSSKIETNMEDNEIYAILYCHENLMHLIPLFLDPADEVGLNGHFLRIPLSLQYTRLLECHAKERAIHRMQLEKEKRQEAPLQGAAECMSTGNNRITTAADPQQILSPSNLQIHDGDNEYIDTELSVGTIVWANFGGRGKFYKATVIRVNKRPLNVYQPKDFNTRESAMVDEIGNTSKPSRKANSFLCNVMGTASNSKEVHNKTAYTYDLHYHDGDKERAVPLERIRRWVRLSSFGKRMSDISYGKSSGNLMIKVSKIYFRLPNQ